MPQYKAIVTLSWQIDTDDDQSQCLENARKQLERILDSNPQGSDFEGFTVQIDLARMRDRKKLIHLGEFSLDEVMPFITEHESKKDFIIDGKIYSVRMNSDRYFVFRDNPTCVACGLTGTKIILDMNPGDQSPHFNFYAEEDGRLVLMTKDHIVAKSRGGGDVMSNYVTCCSICNNLKGHYQVTYEQVRELRKLFDNSAMIPKKDLRDLINQRRDQMVEDNQCRREHG